MCSLVRMNIPPWTEEHRATDRVDDVAVDQLAACELAQRSLWAVEVGAVDLDTLAPVPPSVPPANDDEGLFELLSRAIA